MNLNSLLAWNFKLYRAFGIDVRVHWLLIIYILVKTLSSYEKNSPFSLVLVLAVPVIIFSIVLLHEYGHCIAARLTGGRADNIILWPLGGLAFCSCPHTPKAEFITSSGGLFVNCILIALGYLIRLIYPPEAGPILHWLLAFIIDINITLLLFNLIPCYPLDGGGMLRAVLWPLVGYRKADIYTIWLAIVISGGLLMYGLISSDLFLVLIAVFTFTQAWQEKKAGSSGYCQCSAVPERGETGTPLVENWQSSLKQKRIRKELETEKDIKGRVDRILDKINDVGMENLTEEERHFLNEASGYLNRKNLP